MMAIYLRLLVSAVGVLLCALCACIALVLYGVSTNYHSDSWSGLLIFGFMGALPIIAIAVQLHIGWTWLHSRPADRRVIWLGFVVGAILTLGGALLSLWDRGDYFIYLPFALAGLVMLWVCRFSDPTRPLRGHPPLEGEGK